MGLVLKFLVLIFGLSLGIGLIKYSFQLTQIIGSNYYAERYLGSGGTYTMWKLLGLALIIGVVIYAL